VKSHVAAKLIAAAFAVGTAHAADPTLVSITPDFSFSEYSGSARLGAGEVDIDSTLFFIRERTVGGLESWVIFFDPKHLQRIEAKIHFEHPIERVLTTRERLDSTNLTYGLGDRLRSTRLVGLEPGDQTLWSAGDHELDIRWLASDPGDHVRVLTAVPEPSTSALFVAGALGIGFMLRRRGAVRSLLPRGV